MPRREAGTGKRPAYFADESYDQAVASSDSEQSVVCEILLNPLPKSHEPGTLEFALCEQEPTRLRRRSGLCDLPGQGVQTPIE
jgi:hypothetical protein